MLSINLTVVWRPICESDFRVDYVACEPDCKIAALSAAADIYVNEVEDPELTVADVLNDYELIAVFEGHCKEHVHA